MSCVLILCHSPDDFVVQKPELSTPSICHAPGGEYFVEGETWNIDSCTQCTCHSGRVLCETEVCPPLLCRNPSRTQDSCCPQCTGKQRHASYMLGGEGCSSGCCHSVGPTGQGDPHVGVCQTGYRIRNSYQPASCMYSLYQPPIYAVNVPHT